MRTLYQIYRNPEAYFCTREQPWRINYDLPAQHPDAEACETGSEYTWYCPNCGAHWHTLKDVLHDEEANPGTISSASFIRDETSDDASG